MKLTQCQKFPSSPIMNRFVTRLPHPFHHYPPIVLRFLHLFHRHFLPRLGHLH